MAWTKYQLFLAGLMLVTGSINTLSAKWADRLSARGCNATSEEHTFQHPFLQAVGMFLGEFSCLAVFYLLLCNDRRRSEPTMDAPQSYNPLLFLGPALCDMTGTSLMYVALNMTSASSFQMLRGAVIIFTGLLSVAFLGQKLVLSQWLGILITIVGLVVVGLADLMSNGDHEHKLSEVITGDLLIIMAQVIVAIQMVLEQKFVYKHNVHPLQAVGTEGFFGFLILSLLLVPMYFIPGGQFRERAAPRPGGRPGRLLPDRPGAAHRRGAAGQHQQHRLFQLCRHQRHQGDQRHHQDGAGQPAHRGHLGRQPGCGLGGLPCPPDPRVLHPPVGRRHLQWPPPAPAGTAALAEGGGCRCG
uniref:Solute carrier family 35 member F6 n=1 Tax=Podarcis muralis TaxID=64176 RepID=A0A670I044_PODMU